MKILQSRLKNCIETLLEIKNGLNENHAEFFEPEFIFLKEYLETVDDMSLMEEEVSAMEGSAAAFLEELGRGVEWRGACKILQ